MPFAQVRAVSGVVLTQPKEIEMMHRALDKFGRAGDRMARDFKSLIADSEDLLQAAASAPGEGLTAARAKFEEKLKSAKSALSAATQPMLDRARETAAAADDYVHGNPWSAVGAAVAAGVLVGFLAAKR